MRVAYINEKNEVIALITVPEEVTINELQEQSGKTVIDVTGNDKVGLFWSYSNGKFTKTKKATDFEKQIK